MPFKTIFRTAGAEGRVLCCVILTAAVPACTALDPEQTQHALTPLGSNLPQKKKAAGIDHVRLALVFHPWVIWVVPTRIQRSQGRSRGAVLLSKSDGFSSKPLSALLPAACSPLPPAHYALLIMYY